MVKRPDRPDPEQELPEGAVRVVWAGDDAPVVYANHFGVTHATRTEFFLTFGLLAPPLLLDSSEMPDQLVIRPVVRVVMTPAAMQAAVTVMTQNLDRYLAKANDQADDSDQ